MARILALTKYDDSAASTRQRFRQFLPALRGKEIDVEFAPLFAPDHMARFRLGQRRAVGSTLSAYSTRLRTLLRLQTYDAIWLAYEFFPFLPGFIEGWAASRAGRLIVDYDDAIFHRYDSHRAGPVRALLGSKLEPLLRRADLVVCGNRYLKEYAARFAARTMILPTVVDTDRYLPRARPSSPEQPLIIGWLGSPSTWPNVAAILPALRAAAKDNGALLRMIGAGAAARSDDVVQVVEWNQATEVGDLQRMDVGIMPLEDKPFERGKCGYKLIQYMACGVPVVASPIGVNCEIVQPETGFLATSADDWRRAIGTLLTDREMRLAMGAQGRGAVEERYSLQTHAPRLAAAFRAVLDG